MEMAAAQDIVQSLQHQLETAKKQLLSEPPPNVGIPDPLRVRSPIYDLGVGSILTKDVLEGTKIQGLIWAYMRRIVGDKIAYVYKKVGRPLYQSRHCVFPTSLQLLPRPEVFGIAFKWARIPLLCRVLSHVCLHNDGPSTFKSPRRTRPPRYDPDGTKPPSQH
jgi:hypothetical protein